MKKRVLIVEDDELLSQVVSHNLEHEGFDVRCVANGTEALSEARAFAPNVVLLDLMLPGRSGLDLCEIWSREGRFPIIMITARNLKDDELRGFRAGADDYIAKPFDLDRLLARIHAVLRRARPRVATVTLGDITIDFVNLTASSAGAPLELTHREFAILQHLADHANLVVHRAELLREVWGYPDDPVTRSVDKAIMRLRKKIELDPHHPAFIHTAHGDGYRLTPTDARTGEPESPSRE